MLSRLTIQNRNEPIGYPRIRLSKRHSIFSGRHTNSRWMAGSTYSLRSIDPSALLIVMGV